MSPALPIKIVADIRAVSAAPEKLTPEQKFHRLFYGSFEGPKNFIATVRAWPMGPPAESPLPVPPQPSLLMRLWHHAARLLVTPGPEPHADGAAKKLRAKLDDDIQNLCAVWTLYDDAAQNPRDFNTMISAIDLRRAAMEKTGAAIAAWRAIEHSPALQRALPDRALTDMLRPLLQRPEMRPRVFFAAAGMDVVKIRPASALPTHILAAQSQPAARFVPMGGLSAPRKRAGRPVAQSGPSRRDRRIMLSFPVAQS
jgi:hypothetical protein